MSIFDWRDTELLKNKGLIESFRAFFHTKESTLGLDSEIPNVWTDKSKYFQLNGYSHLMMKFTCDYLTLHQKNEVVTVYVPLQSHLFFAWSSILKQSRLVFLITIVLNSIQHAVYIVNTLKLAVSVWLNKWHWYSLVKSSQICLNKAECVKAYGPYITRPGFKSWIGFCRWYYLFNFLCHFPV